MEIISTKVTIQLSLAEVFSLWRLTGAMSANDYREKGLTAKQIESVRSIYTFLNKEFGAVKL